MTRRPFAWMSVGFVCVTWALGPGARGQGLEVKVRKQAAAANPTLAVRHFAGSQGLRDALARILVYSDWFTVVDSPMKATYVLDVTTTPIGELEMKLFKGDRPAAHVRWQSQSGQVDHFALCRSIDEVIEVLFKNPGPCSSRLAFVLATSRGKEVFTCGFDGTDFRQMTRNASISTEPTWGGKGAQLTYTLYRQSRTQTVLADLYKGNQRRLSAHRGLNSGAALSPDGTLAALCMSQSGAVDLYIMDVKNGATKNLTRDRAVEASPCWSPDGTRICYVSDQDGRPQLHLVNLRTNRSNRILRDPTEMVSPDWSAVSNRICFATRQGSGYVLAYIDMDESSPTKTIFAQGSGDWESPSWLPDGRHVVCSRKEGKGTKLCLVDSWHGRVLPLTQSGEYTLPASSPALQANPVSAAK